MEGYAWGSLFSGQGQWQILVNTAMNSGFLKMRGNYELAQEPLGSQGELCST